MEVDEIAKVVNVELGYAAVISLAAWADEGNDGGLDAIVADQIPIAECHDGFLNWCGKATEAVNNFGGWCFLIVEIIGKIKLASLPLLCKLVGVVPKLSSMFKLACSPLSA